MQLTTKKLWDERHKVHGRSPGQNDQIRKGLVRKIVDHARYKQGAEIGQSFSSFLFQRLLRRHLPVRSDWTAIEIGCAPGSNLVALHRDFAYQPYGVEYSHTGVLLARETFSQYGFDPAGVIEADLFDREFQDSCRGKFDVVFSQGFIEHFDPPDEVLGLHANLLKTGGFLVCTIPNLRGVCYPYLRLCAREHLKLHNCSLMHKKAFRRVFEPLGLDIKFCGHVGGPDLHASQFRHERNLRGFSAKALDRVQDMVDHFLFFSYRGYFPRCRLSSDLAFIGQRIS